MPMILYGRHNSYNVQKVLWLLAELELDYQAIELGSNQADTKTGAFGRLNPMVKFQCWWMTIKSSGSRIQYYAIW